eukprot:Pgem_evm1s1918
MFLSITLNFEPKLGKEEYATQPFRNLSGDFEVNLRDIVFITQYTNMISTIK